MRRSNKIKVAIARLPLRKAAAVPAITAISPRRAYPAWIDAGERAVAFPATTVTSRVRDGLVLRVVGLKKIVRSKKTSHGSSAP
jgi:hypothetical protein